MRSAPIGRQRCVIIQIAIQMTQMPRENFRPLARRGSGCSNTTKVHVAGDTTPTRPKRMNSAQRIQAAANLREASNITRHGRRCSHDGLEEPAAVEGGQIFLVSNRRPRTRRGANVRRARLRGDATRSSPSAKARRRESAGGEAHRRRPRPRKVEAARTALLRIEAAERANTST